MVSTQQIMFWKISKSRWKQLDSNEPIVQRRYAFSFNISICWFQHQMVSTLVMLEILLIIQRILNKVNFELQVQYSMFWTVRHGGDQEWSLCWFTRKLRFHLRKLALFLMWNAGLPSTPDTKATPSASGVLSSSIKATKSTSAKERSKPLTVIRMAKVW